jgi:hypothetical protein
LSPSSRGGCAPARTVNLHLADKVSRVLDAYHRRPLNVGQDSPWSLLHWGIAFGKDSRVAGRTGFEHPITAIDWLCHNGTSAGVRIMHLNRGLLSLPIAPGMQGHHAQFLAMLAQSDVDPNRELRVENRRFEVRDLIEHEKLSCKRGMELTFKLIGISHYTPSEEVWRNEQGEAWNVRRLLIEELNQPIDRMTCCCGGSHRLFAWSYAVDRRRSEGKPVDGPWAIAASRVRAYQQRALRFQNRDGSFSTLWMERPANSGDLTRRVLTTGHTLEWLAASLPASQLSDPRFEKAVYYVADVLERNQSQRWHRGALGHALHALSIYEQRVVGATPGERLARQTGANPSR